MQILTTEHFVLQSARSAATMESSARSSLYLTVLSATFSGPADLDYGFGQMLRSGRGELEDSVVASGEDDDR